MTEEKIQGLVEDILESESIQELEALIRDAEVDYPGITSQVDVAKTIQNRREGFKLKVVGDEVVVVNTSEIEDLRARLLETQRQMEQLVALASNRFVERPPVRRAARMVKLLSTDVSWSTKYQVHALMKILSAHVAVGEQVSEDDVVRMMEANVELLQTVQSAKRIWDYYKGKHLEGLEAHGNIERR